VITTVMSQTRLDTLTELAAQLRVDSIRASTAAGSGHPTSSIGGGPAGGAGCQASAL
jgi:transketolase